MANAGPDERFDQAATSKALAYVSGDRTDVSSSATGDFELETRPGIVPQVDLVNPHKPGCKLRRPAGPRQIIGPFALDFLGRVGRWQLRDFAHHASKHSPNVFLV